MELNFLNYHSIFSMFVIKNNKIETIFDRKTQICFRIIFESLSDRGLLNKTEYKLILFKTKRPLIDLRWNNYCPFNKKVITNHLKQAQKIVPELVSFGIEDSNIGGDPCYEISLTLNPTYKIVHKYVLTWTRFLYESCFSLMLMDALRLSKLPEFRFVSIANILNIVTACYKGNYPHFNAWHGISTGTINSFLTFQEIRKNLLKIEYLNDLYATHPKIKQKFELKNPPENKAYFLNFWESDEDFEKFRKETYLRCFNILKVDYPYCH